MLQKNQSILGITIYLCTPIDTTINKIYKIKQFKYKVMIFQPQSLISKHLKRITFALLNVKQKGKDYD